MADLIPDDYSGWMAAGGLVKGFSKGLMDAEELADRREDRKFKRMEFEAKMRADQTEKDKKTEENTYKKSKDQFEKAQGLRKEYLSNKVTQNSQAVKEAYDKIQSAAPSAAGDMSLIYGFMRMQDPGSTVREGEFATAQNAAGIQDQVRNAYNRAISGERLNPNQRLDFKSSAGRILAAQMKNQSALESEYGGLADTYEVPRGEVTLKIFEDPQTGEKKIVEVPAKAQGAAPQQGLLAPQEGLVNKGLVAKPKASAPAVDPGLKRLEELRRKAAGG